MVDHTYVIGFVTLFLFYLFFFLPYFPPFIRTRTECTTKSKLELVVFLLVRLYLCIQYYFIVLQFLWLFDSIYFLFSFELLLLLVFLYRCIIHIFIVYYSFLFYSISFCFLRFFFLLFRFDRLMIQVELFTGCVLCVCASLKHKMRTRWKLSAPKPKTKYKKYQSLTSTEINI